MANESPPAQEGRFAVPALVGWLVVVVGTALAAAQVAPDGWRRAASALLILAAGIAGILAFRLPRRAQRPTRLRHDRRMGYGVTGMVVITALTLALLPTAGSPQSSAEPSASIGSTHSPSASTGPRPDLENVVASLDILKNGDPIEAPDSYLLPYGITVPPPAAVGWCGEQSTTLFRTKGVHIGGYARAVIQNTNDQGNDETVQILDIRTKVVSSTEPHGGIRVLCTKTQGDTPKTADLRAEDGRLALTGLEDNAPPPLSFELTPGEQEVVNLELLPGQKDNLIQIVADAVIRGERAEIPLTKEPLLVRSDSAAEYQLDQTQGLTSGSAIFVCVLTATQQPCDPSDARAPRL